MSDRQNAPMDRWAWLASGKCPEVLALLNRDRFKAIWTLLESLGEMRAQAKSGSAPGLGQRDSLQFLFMGIPIVNLNYQLLFWNEKGIVKLGFLLLKNRVKDGQPSKKYRGAYAGGIERLSIYLTKLRHHSPALLPASLPKKAQV
jgi:hypothetical protein